MKYRAWWGCSASEQLFHIAVAAGSLIFSYLLLRGRMVPVSIAWLGVFASGLLVVVLPLQLAGFSTGPLTGYYQWLPVTFFRGDSSAGSIVTMH
jgi:hypothetical protein